MTRSLVYGLALTTLWTGLGGAQQHTPKMDHAAHGAAAPTGKGAASAPDLPGRPGQDAYGAIAEIVRLLESDSTTDWGKVDLERLRQHLIDLNAVTLRSKVTQRAVAVGLEMEVTGDDPATQAAIRRMTAAHATQLPAHGILMTTEPIARGARLVATARDAGDTGLVAKIRGLGFIGLLALGDHHAPHHLAMARGGPASGHGSH